MPSDPTKPVNQPPVYQPPAPAVEPPKPPPVEPDPPAATTAPEDHQCAGSEETGTKEQPKPLVTGQLREDVEKRLDELVPQEDGRLDALEQLKEEKGEAMSQAVAEAMAQSALLGMGAAAKALGPLGKPFEAMKKELAQNILNDPKLREGIEAQVDSEIQVIYNEKRKVYLEQHPEVSQGYTQLLAEGLITEQEYKAIAQKEFMTQAMALDGPEGLQETWANVASQMGMSEQQARQAWADMEQKGVTAEVKQRLVELQKSIAHVGETWDRVVHKNTGRHIPEGVKSRLGQNGHKFLSKRIQERHEQTGEMPSQEEMQQIATSDECIEACMADVQEAELEPAGLTLQDLSEAGHSPEVKQALGQMAHAKFGVIGALISFFEFVWDNVLLIFLQTYNEVMADVAKNEAKADEERDLEGYEKNRQDKNADQLTAERKSQDQNSKQIADAAKSHATEHETEKVIEVDALKDHLHEVALAETDEDMAKYWEGYRQDEERLEDREKKEGDPGHRAFLGLLSGDKSHLG